MIQGLEFDDVLIKPMSSTVSSRDDVDISIKLSDHLLLNFPLIASPMVGVVDGAFAKALSDLGGLAIFHRFYKSKIALYDDIQSKIIIGKDKFGISVSVNDENFEDFFGFCPSIILVDTANGYTKNLLDYCLRIKNHIEKNNYKTLLMAGNVATKEGCFNLYNSGCDIIRVGIGGGSPCSTRNQTGIGVPAVSALMSIREHDEYYKPNGETFNAYNFDCCKIVYDGGIKAPGDLVKALVAGADLGMAGRLFAECFEAPNKGVLYGMASRTHMKNAKLEVKSVEGIDTIIIKKQSLEQFIREFGYGIKSAGTYLNAKNLFEIARNGEFIHVTDNAIKKGL